MYVCLDAFSTSVHVYPKWSLLPFQLDNPLCYDDNFSFLSDYLVTDPILQRDSEHRPLIPSSSTKLFLWNYRSLHEIPHHYNYCSNNGMYDVCSMQHRPPARRYALMQQRCDTKHTRYAINHSNQTRYIFCSTAAAGAAESTTPEDTPCFVHSVLQRNKIYINIPIW